MMHADLMGGATAWVGGTKDREVAFVDDIITWHATRARLTLKLEHLAQELAKWGLKLNPAKCQIYHSPAAEDTWPISLVGTVVPECDHVNVMGYKLWAGIGVKEAMLPMFAKGKHKFWAVSFRAASFVAHCCGEQHHAERWGVSTGCRGHIHAVNTLQTPMVVGAWG